MCIMVLSFDFISEAAENIVENNTVVNNTVENDIGADHTPDTINVELNISAPEKIAEGEKSVEVKFSLGKFTNIEQGQIMAIQAKFEYDTEIVESVTCEATGKWSMEYNATTQKILADTSAANENDEIGKLKVTFKEPITAENKINFSLAEVKIAPEGIETTITPDKKTIALPVEKKVEETPTPTEENKTTQEENSNKIDNTTATKAIPAAGLRNVLLMVIGITIIMAIVFRFKARKIK